MKCTGILALVLSATVVKAQYQFEDNFMTGAISVDYNSGLSGSAFLFSDSLHVYLITARHVIYYVDTITGRPTDILNGDTAYLTTYSDNINTDRIHKVILSIKGLNDARLVVSDPMNDIAVIVLANVHNGGINYNDYVNVNESRHVSTVRMEQMSSSESVHYGVDVFVLGYPKSLHIISNQIELSKPLLTRGIIAGKNSLNGTLILNAQIHHGNSGGPVWAAFPNEFKVVGIVTQLIPFESQVFQNGRRISGVGVLNNSNFSVVQPLEHIFPLIDKLRRSTR